MAAGTWVFIPPDPLACDTNRRTWTEPDGRTATVTVACIGGRHGGDWHTHPGGTMWRWANDGVGIIMNSGGNPIVRDVDESGLNVTWDMT